MPSSDGQTLNPGVYRDPRSCYVASLTGGMTAD
jgi:hypothetical protein